MFNTATKNIEDALWRTCRFTHEVECLKDPVCRDTEVVIRVGAEVGTIRFPDSAFCFSVVNNTTPTILEGIWEKEEELLMQHLDKNIVALSEPLC